MAQLACVGDDHAPRHHAHINRGDARVSREARCHPVGHVPPVAHEVRSHAKATGNLRMSQFQVQSSALPGFATAEPANEWRRHSSYLTQSDLWSLIGVNTTEVSTSLTRPLDQVTEVVHRSRGQACGQGSTSSQNCYGCLTVGSNCRKNRHVSRVWQPRSAALPRFLPRRWTWDG
jgi:hypothetical protein